MEPITPNPSDPLAEHGQTDTLTVEDQLPTQKHERTSKTIVPFFLKKSEEYRELTELRQIGWSNPAGDTFFAKQRQAADEPTEKAVVHIHMLMKRIAAELHRATGAFKIKQAGNTLPDILDMCMAPGAFLEFALRQNPKSQALAFSLPIPQGGHKVRLPKFAKVEQRFLDITMLAADMGAGAIPEDHPDAGNFFPRQFEAGQLFDLILCDGQVLRTHIRAPYREKREARRLTNTQLALGLEHLRPGGSMVVLLHKFEAWDTLNLIRRFSRFSSVKVCKPKQGHATRSSFYMIATNIQSQHPEAIQAIEKWKMIWRVATFGSDEEYQEAIWAGELTADEFLESFGMEAVELGREIWKIQAEGLARAPYITSQKGKKKASGSSGYGR